MIIDAQIFIPSPKAVKLQVSESLEALVLDAIFLFVHAKLLMCDSALAKLSYLGSSVGRASA